MKPSIPTWTEIEDRVNRLECEALERRIRNLEVSLLYRNATTEAILKAIRKGFKYPWQSQEAQP